MDRLATTCQRVASYSSRLKKVRFVADYLRSLSDADLVRAVRFLCCAPIQSADGKFSIGGSILREAAIAATGLDRELYAICYHEVGDTGETVSLLSRAPTNVEPMSLADAELLYARLYKLKRTADKVELLRQIFVRYQPLTLKFFIKVITGNLRTGFLAKQVEEALAEATGVSLDEIRRANNRLGDLARIAVAARQDTLDEIQARLFHPMDFMLAKPLDEVDHLPDPENWWVEDKYDGFRSQVHIENGRVMIFTRGMEDVTGAFPDLVEALHTLTGSSVIDGEILAWRDGRPLSFNVLQQRITRKSVKAEMLAEVPVLFMAYDLLYENGRMLLDEPLETRRAALEHALLSRPSAIEIAPQQPAVSSEKIERSFTDARARGNEGLLLKRSGSLYESGKRSGAWLKVKRPYATLDVVVTAAEQGSGRRAIWLSDYTFAVKQGDQFLNIGKAYLGLTDDEVRELTRVLRGVTIERFGKVALVKPLVVFEVAFDLIQKSARHKSGYSLRFPRIVRWRKDKTPEQADTLDRVRELYEASMSS
jgi:DNA ligase-1